MADLNKSKLQIIADYICLNSTEFQSCLPEQMDKFHVINGIKSETDRHKTPLILQGRLPEIIEYVTFELNDYLNLFNNNMYKHSFGRIDIFKFIKVNKQKQDFLNSQSLPINLEGKIQIIENNYFLDELQTPQGLLKASSYQDSPNIRNIFIPQFRYT